MNIYILVYLYLLKGFKENFIKYNYFNKSFLLPHSFKGLNKLVAFINIFTVTLTSYNLYEVILLSVYLRGIA